MSETIKIKGIPIGTYPDLMPEARIIYSTPREYIARGANQLITILRSQEDSYIVSFWTWSRDRRFTTEVKGTWTLEDIVLNRRQLHAFQRMDFGGLKISARELVTA